MFNFCRSKCLKAFKRKKNPRKTKWTKIHRMVRKKETTVITERRMNEPVPLNQDILAESISRIPQILEINQKNADLYIRDRILSEREKKKATDLKHIEKHIHLSTKEKKNELGKKRTSKNIELN